MSIPSIEDIINEIKELAARVEDYIDSDRDRNNTAGLVSVHGLLEGLIKAVQRVSEDVAQVQRSLNDLKGAEDTIRATVDHILDRVQCPVRKDGKERQDGHDPRSGL